MAYLAELYMLGQNGQTITADSIPDLDDWGVDEYWGCNDWVSWHKLNKKKYGKPVADQKFIFEWGKQGFGASALDCRTFNSSFRSYMRKEKLFDDVYDSAGFFKYVLQPVGTGGDIVTETTKGISTGARILKYLIPGAFIGVAIWGGIKLYKAYK